MMKPGMGSYNEFKQMFDHYSKLAGKKQFLIPYFISAHPGTTDMDMVNLALWLKKNNFKLDQVQNFYPSPLANATTIYHTEIDSLNKIRKENETVPVPKGTIKRRLHKAILRYHDQNNWGLIREALRKMGLAKKLIGSGPECLVPHETRGEKNSSSRNGRKNTNGNKTPYGQKRGDKVSRGKSNPGLTRFSNDQFKKRKKSD